MSSPLAAVRLSIARVEVEVLAREQPAGPAESACDFIGDEQRAVTPAEVSYPPDGVFLWNQHAEIDADRLHDEGGDIVPLQPLLDAAQCRRVERRGNLAAVRQQVLNLLAVVGSADAQPARRVAVVTAFERQEGAPPGVYHRGLQREVDRFGSTGRAETCRQRTGGQRREQPRELGPRCIRVPGIDVIGPLEAFDGFRDRRGAPSEILDAPAHHEVDVLPAARVGDDAAVRGGNLQFRWFLSGEWLAASSGHEGILSVRGYGSSIIIEDQYVRIASRSSTRDSRSTFSCAVRTERSEIATECPWANHRIRHPANFIFRP